MTSASDTVNKIWETPSWKGGILVSLKSKDTPAME